MTSTAQKPTGEGLAAISAHLLIKNLDRWMRWSPATPNGPTADEAKATYRNTCRQIWKQARECGFATELAEELDGRHECEPDSREVPGAIVCLTCGQVLKGAVVQPGPAEDKIAPWFWEVQIVRGGRSIDFGPVRIRLDSSLPTECTPLVIRWIALALEANSARSEAELFDQLGQDQVEGLNLQGAPR